MRRGITLLACAALLTNFVAVEPVQATGAFVAGCATGGPLATPMGVSFAATSAAKTVSNAVKQMGRSTKSEQKKITAAINKNFETQNSVLRQTVASLGVSMKKMENMKTFGPQSKAYGAGMVEDRFNTVMSGRSAESGLAAHFSQSIDQHARGFDRHHERILYYDQEDASSVSPSFFFPRDATLSGDELGKALFAIKSVVDPFPSPGLPEKYQETGKADAYEALRKIKYSRLAMPVSVISDITSSYAPVVELGEWGEKMYERMEGSGEPPQLEDGKISVMGYIDMMVNARFANQDWHSGQDGIHGMTEAGLLREMLVMESVNMEMQRRQTRYMQQTAGLLAQDQAAETGREFNESLNQIYKKVAR